METTAGQLLSAVTVEAVISALTRQLDDQRTGEGFRWSVTTPHGTVLTDQVGADPYPGDGPTAAAAAVERAYGLLVRDHLTHATPPIGTRHLLTM